MERCKMLCWVIRIHWEVQFVDVGVCVGKLPRCCLPWNPSVLKKLPGTFWKRLPQKIIHTIINILKPIVMKNGYCTAPPPFPPPNYSQFIVHCVWNCIHTAVYVPKSQRWPWLWHNARHTFYENILCISRSTNDTTCSLKHTHLSYRFYIPIIPFGPSPLQPVWPPGLNSLQVVDGAPTATTLRPHSCMPRTLTIQSPHWFYALILRTVRNLSKVQMPASPLDNSSAGGDRQCSTASPHLSTFIRHLDESFCQGRHSGLSQLQAALYAVNASQPAETICRTPAPESLTSHESNDDQATLSSVRRLRCSHSDDREACTSDESCVHICEDAGEAFAASSQLECLREQMKTLDDSERLKLCHSRMMGQFMRSRASALENTVRDIYKSQYVRQSRDGSIIHQISDSVVSDHNLGCKNYARNCKLKANCCGLFVCCRVCHDEHLGEDHEIDRFATKSVLCMVCLTEQPVGEQCVECDTKFAHYFCSKCRFYENDADKKIFHCDKCNICRVGEGLNIDTFHCERCDCCVPIKFKGNHKCFNQSLHSNCPICTRHLFTSKDPVEYTSCGHAMHQECFDEYIKTRYQCPLCMKSLLCMDEYFQNIDEFMRHEVIPAEFQRKRSRIFCNDCGQKSVAPFHFIYHKCEGPMGCNSYNTMVIDTVDASEEACDRYDDGEHAIDDRSSGSRRDMEELGDHNEEMDVDSIGSGGGGVYGNDNTCTGSNVFWEMDEIITSEGEDEGIWEDEDFIDENAEMAISFAESASTCRPLYAAVGAVR